MQGFKDVRGIVIQRYNEVVCWWIPQVVAMAAFTPRVDSRPARQVSVVTSREPMLPSFHDFGVTRAEDLVAEFINSEGS